MSTETIRAQLDERCRDASRADGTRRSMLARAGVAAGTLGLLGLAAPPARAATTRFDDTVEVVPPPGAAALRLLCSGSVPHSAVTGGGAEPRQHRVQRRRCRALLQPGSRCAWAPAGREPGQPLQPSARRSDPERGHGAHGVDLPRPRRRGRRSDRRGGRHRLHQRAGHGTRRAGSGDRQGHGQDHPRQAARLGRERVRVVDRARGSRDGVPGHLHRQRRRKPDHRRPAAHPQRRAGHGPVAADRSRPAGARGAGVRGWPRRRRRREPVPRGSGLLATDGALRLAAAGANVSGGRWCAAHIPVVSHDHAESRRRAAGSGASRRGSPPTAYSTRRRCRCSA